MLKRKTNSLVVVGEYRTFCTKYISIAMCESAEEKLCSMRNRMFEQRIRFAYVQQNVSQLKTTQVLDFECVRDAFAAQHKSHCLKQYTMTTSYRRSSVSSDSSSGRHKRGPRTPPSPPAHVNGGSSEAIDERRSPSSHSRSASPYNKYRPRSRRRERSPDRRSLSRRERSDVSVRIDF